MAFRGAASRSFLAAVRGRTASTVPRAIGGVDGVAGVGCRKADGALRGERAGVL
ncbi:hypothetical protein TRIUR3_18662 [Triticum urartu]|uniref:Uncharacterized protein n=1 Tax=Triticum urartu TaxID=4572 RepID=M7ZB23_TRIUA|nr:hypothetical protein TRIUR3_18662 [Triticum urartu]